MILHVKVWRHAGSDLIQALNLSNMTNEIPKIESKKLKYHMTSLNYNLNRLKITILLN